MRRARAPVDRGAATVLVLTLVAVVLALSVGGLVIASCLVASQRARVAADLGSLAGASALQDGLPGEQACSVASRVALANGAATQACSVQGETLDLRVRVATALWPQPATARGRAGPQP